MEDGLVPPLRPVEAVLAEVPLDDAADPARGQPDELPVGGREPARPRLRRREVDGPVPLAVDDDRRPDVRLEPERLEARVPVVDRGRHLIDGHHLLAGRVHDVRVGIGQVEHVPGRQLRPLRRGARDDLKAVLGEVDPAEDAGLEVELGAERLDDLADLAHVVGRAQGEGVGERLDARDVGLGLLLAEVALEQGPRPQRSHPHQVLVGLGEGVRDVGRPEAEGARDLAVDHDRRAHVGAELFRDPVGRVERRLGKVGDGNEAARGDGQQAVRPPDGQVGPDGRRLALGGVAGEHREEAVGDGRQQAVLQAQHVRHLAQDGPGALVERPLDGGGREQAPEVGGLGGRAHLGLHALGHQRRHGDGAAPLDGDGRRLDHLAGDSAGPRPGRADEHVVEGVPRALLGRDEVPDGGPDGLVVLEPERAEGPSSTGGDGAGGVEGKEDHRRTGERGVEEPLAVGGRGVGHDAVGDVETDGDAPDDGAVVVEHRPGRRLELPVGERDGPLDGLAREHPGHPVPDLGGVGIEQVHALPDQEVSVDPDPFQGLAPHQRHAALGVERPHDRGGLADGLKERLALLAVRVGGDPGGGVDRDADPAIDPPVGAEQRGDGGFQDPPRHRERPVDRLARQHARYPVGDRGLARKPVGDEVADELGGVAADRVQHLATAQREAPLDVEGEHQHRGAEERGVEQRGVLAQLLDGFDLVRQVFGLDHQTRHLARRRVPRLDGRAHPQPAGRPVDRHGVHPLGLSAQAPLVDRAPRLRDVGMDIEDALSDEGRPRLHLGA